MTEILARSLLVAVISIGCLAQQPGDGYAVLKSALGLNDSQLRQLQQALPPGPAVRQTLLNGAQKARLAVIERVLYQGKLASEAIVLGLISEEEWPGATLCYYSILYYAYASEIGLSFSQARQFEQLRHAASTRPPRDLAMALLNDAQKAKIAAFEIELHAATEAIELGLIPAPPKAEILCH